MTQQGEFWKLTVMKSPGHQAACYEVASCHTVGNAKYTHTHTHTHTHEANNRGMAEFTYSEKYVAM